MTDDDPDEPGVDDETVIMGGDDDGSDLDDETVIRNQDGDDDQPGGQGGPSVPSGSSDDGQGGPSVPSGSSDDGQGGPSVPSGSSGGGQGQPGGQPTSGQPGGQPGSGQDQPGGQPTGGQPGGEDQPSTGSQGGPSVPSGSSTGGQGQPSTGGQGQPSTGGQGQPSTGGQGQPSTGGQGQPSTGGQGQAASGTGGVESSETATQSTGGSSGSGLDPEIAGALAYLFAPLGGIAMYVIDDDEFVQFHAKQGIAFGLLMIVVWIGATIVWFLGGILLNGVPGLGLLWGIVSFLMYPVIGLIGFALWAFLTYKAYQGERYGLPVIGGMVA